MAPNFPQLRVLHHSRLRTKGVRLPVGWLLRRITTTTTTEAKLLTAPDLLRLDGEGRA